MATESSMFAQPFTSAVIVARRAKQLFKNVAQCLRKQVARYRFHLPRAPEPSTAQPVMTNSQLEGSVGRQQFCFTGRMQFRSQSGNAFDGIATDIQRKAGEAKRTETTAKAEQPQN
uniref:Uncharacterized protein n=1 Tax=Trichuris muris TaxID=70415 RepID=A0A5S6Q9X0_TRIMR